MNQENNQENNELPSFVPFPRTLKRDVKEAKLTYGEYEIYVWMRLHTDIKGTADVSIAGLLADLPHFKSEDNLSKFVRSLRRKKYIYYLPRQGRRGSFLVEFGDWMLKGRVMKHLETYFEQEKLRSSNGDLEAKKPEVTPTSSPQTPKLNDKKLPDSMRSIGQLMQPRFRSQYTNTDTEKDTKAVDYSIANKEEKPWRKVVTHDFDAKNDVQRRCKEIAVAIGDPYMNYILGKLKKANGDMRIIERGFADFKEACRAYEKDGKRVERPAALFNTCLEAVFIEKELEE